MDLGKAYNLASSNYLRYMHLAFAFNAESKFDLIWRVMSCILKWKGKGFPNTIDIWIDKGVAEIKSTTLSSHVEESYKARLGKQESFTYTKIPQSRFLENHLQTFLENILSFENSLLGHSKSIFQKESLGG